jgi:hypothetical protein
MGVDDLERLVLGEAHCRAGAREAKARSESGQERLLRPYLR